MFLGTWKDLAECDTAVWMSGNIGQACKCHISVQGMQQGLLLLTFLDPFTVRIRMFWKFFLFLLVLSSFVSWCHGGNTSAVSYFQDSEEAVCDILEKHFSSTCCCFGMAGNLMSPECVPPKLRILTHRSTIPCRCQADSEACLWNTNFIYPFYLITLAGRHLQSSTCLL